MYISNALIRHLIQHSGISGLVGDLGYRASPAWQQIVTEHYSLWSSASHIYPQLIMYKIVTILNNIYVLATQML